MVRRSDDSHIHRNGARATDPLQLTLLQHPQQLHLHRRGHVADLVQEQRPTVRQLEPSLAPGARTRERALLVTEQLALDQALGHRPAIELDERASGSIRRHVDRVGDQLLARPVLTEDQHPAFGRSQLADQLSEMLHRSALPQQLSRPIDLLLELLMVHAQPGVAQRIAHAQQQAFGLERLLDVVHRAELECVGHVARRAGARQDDRRRLVSLFLQLLQEFQPVRFGHEDVDQQQVRPVLLQHRQRLARRPRRAHAIARRRENALGQRQSIRIVVDDEQSRGHRFVTHGSAGSEPTLNPTCSLGHLPNDGPGSSAPGPDEAPAAG